MPVDNQASIQGGCHRAADPVGGRPNGYWWRQLLYGAPGFFTSRTELFVLCMVRAGLYPVIVLWAYVFVASLFGHTTPTTLERYLVAALFPFFEEHSRLVFASRSGAPVATAAGYSLAFGVVESLVMIPLWLSGESSSVVGSWSAFLVVRLICTFAHVCFGAIIGVGLLVGRNTAYLAMAMATLVHTLFNVHGVSVVLLAWLSGE